MGSIRERSELQSVKDGSSYVCLISVASRKFTSYLASAYSRWEIVSGAHVHFVALEELEVYNVKALEGIGTDEAEVVAATRTSERLEALGLGEGGALSWGDVCGLVDFEHWRRKVWERFDGGGQFRRHILNQTYANLMPIFRAKGVKRKTDGRVTKCAPYLLDEVAFKLAAFCGGPFRGEIAPRPESELVLRLYGGEYFEVEARPEGFELVCFDGSREGRFDWRRNVDVSAAREYFQRWQKTRGIPGSF